MKNKNQLDVNRSKHPKHFWIMVSTWKGNRSSLEVDAVVKNTVTISGWRK